MRQCSKPAQAHARILLASAFLAIPAATASAQTPAPAPHAAGVTAGPAGKRKILVSIPDRKLALIEDGRVIKVYPIAVGVSSSPTPAGRFRVINRLTDPAYYSPGLVIPPGDDNPLGPRWIGLNQKSFGIHGTNEPHSIGRRASHGCVRMRNQDVLELFELVRVGDTVELVGERTQELAQVFGAPVTPVAKPVAPAVPAIVAAVVPVTSQ
jgi:lipoprotein-anchoring transpeptidase ErfK/SrfK